LSMSSLSDSGRILTESTKAKMHPQLTLVAYYGEKPKGFVKLIENCQNLLAKHLAAHFIPYPIHQVHGTIIGLELEKGQHGWHAVRSLQPTKPLDIGQLLDHLKNYFKEREIQLQLGGFSEKHELKFPSTVVMPYWESFSINGSIAVAKGWPVKADGEALNEWRRSFNPLNITHKYHRDKSAIDNDFFFVLGHVEYENLTKQRLRNTAHSLRQFMSRLSPFFLPLSFDCLSLVLYSDDRLPVQTSRVFPLASEQFENLQTDAFLSLLEDS